MVRLTVAALAAACMLATPARADIIEVAPGGFVTRDSAAVGADPQTVWLALISPGGWWNDAHSWSGDAANMSIVPQGGGCFCERIPAQDEGGAIGLDGSVQHMVVLQANPRKVLRMRGALGPLQSEPADGVLTITLKPVEGGTRIVWEYVVGGYMRYAPQVIAKAVDAVMTQQLDGLAESLGRIPDPDAGKAAGGPAKGAADAGTDAAKEADEAGKADEADEADEADGTTADDAAGSARPTGSKAGSLIGEDFLEEGDAPPPERDEASREEAAEAVEPQV